MKSLRQKEKTRVGGNFQGRSAGRDSSRDGFLESSKALGREVELALGDVRVAGTTANPSASLSASARPWLESKSLPSYLVLA